MFSAINCVNYTICVNFYVENIIWHQWYVIVISADYRLLSCTCISDSYS